MENKGMDHIRPPEKAHLEERPKPSVDTIRRLATGSNQGLVPLEGIRKPERAYKGSDQEIPEIPSRAAAPDQEKLDKLREAGLFKGFGSQEESRLQDLPAELRHPVKRFMEGQRFLNIYAKRQEEYFKGHYLEDIRERRRKLGESIDNIIKNLNSSSVIFGANVEAYNEYLMSIRQQLPEFEERIQRFKRYIQENPEPSMRGPSNPDRPSAT